MPAALLKNRITKDGYRAEDTADAWKRTLDFLAAALKP
jgi:dienelactone hydrolase